MNPNSKIEMKHFYLARRKGLGATALIRPSVTFIRY